MEIKKVKTTKELERVAVLAYKIWNQHFVPIIGQEQVDYMVDKFQSKSAMAGQMESGYEYFYLSESGQEKAYLAIVPDESAKRMMISKIYVEMEMGEREEISKGGVLGSYHNEAMKRARDDGRRNGDKGKG